MAMPFLPVAAEQARFFLRELDWGGQFIGTALNPTLGNTPIYIYSLAEANKFFAAGHTSLGTLGGSSRVGISWVEAPEFVRWVRDSLQDLELAIVIERALAEAAGPSGQADAGSAADAAADAATDAAADAAAAAAAAAQSPLLPYLKQAKIMAELVHVRLLQLREVLDNAE